MPNIKDGIITYKSGSSLNAFAHHTKYRLLCKDLFTKTIYFFLELATVVEDLYHRLRLKFFGSQSPNKEARSTYWNILTTLIVCLFGVLHAV